MTELHFFDRHADYTVIERRLPHWVQPGIVCFLTFRTHDSIPRKVLTQWISDREQWLRQHQVDPEAADWNLQLRKLSQEQQTEFYRKFSTKWHENLDACHGACVLRNPQLAKIVGDSLRKFDGERYILTDFIVIPNHVHALVAFGTNEGLLKQCESWKHFTARQINRALGQKGRFWQQDGFDHLVRSEEQFHHFRRYIGSNAEKANLKPGESLHYSVKL